MSIKRYDVGMTTENNPHGFNHSFPWVYEAEKGKYVEYADYARLKAEVERLTKAGDEIAYGYQNGDWNERKIANRVSAWEDAKKGVQP